MVRGLVSLQKHSSNDKNVGIKRRWDVGGNDLPLHWKFLMKRNKNVHFGFIFSSSSPSIFSFSFSVQIPISSLQSKFSYF